MPEIVTNVLLDFVLIGLPFAYYKLKNKEFLKEIGIKKINALEGLEKSFYIVVVLMVASFFISFFLTTLQLNDLVKVKETIGEISTVMPLLLVYLLIMRVISEEIFFRGFLVKNFGVLPATLAFGAAHFVYGSTAEVVGAIVLGYILAIVYLKNKNLVPNIVAHVVYNVLVIALMVG